MIIKIFRVIRNIAKEKIMGRYINTPKDMWRTHQMLKNIKNSEIKELQEYQRQITNPYKHAIMGYIPPQPKMDIFQRTTLKTKNFFENIKFKFHCLVK